MNWLAVDIGGANIKLADGNGYAESLAFPMWKQSEQLGEVLKQMLSAAPSHEALAVTMTAELADCFATKSDGVRFVIDRVKETFSHLRPSVYSKQGRFLSTQEALAVPHLVAASNWHALASYAARFAPRCRATLIDVGSTTTDIVPLENGDSHPYALDDTSRLVSGELIYTGVSRTPVCGVERTGPYRGDTCRLAKELFATMRDVYLVLRDLPEEPLCQDTTDGRPATRPCAIARLARCLCADTEIFDEQDAASLARHLASAQAREIREGLIAVLKRTGWGTCKSFILCGQGEFIARQIVKASFPGSSIQSLSEILGETASRCAPAHAVAVLARETE